MPLILSRSVPQAARRAFLWQALALARQLEPSATSRCDDAERQARADRRPASTSWTALAAPLGGPWQRPRYRREAVELALTALHACRRDLHYVVRDGAIELLDEVTGRIAERPRLVARPAHRGRPEGGPGAAGRNRHRGPDHLPALLPALLARGGTQRHAARGARRTARRATARAWCAIPLHAPLPAPGAAAALSSTAPAPAGRAVCERVGRAAAPPAGRCWSAPTASPIRRPCPRCLHAAGIAHRVLNALHDADEAAIVADAGRAGQVTVATRMAGRGTDIALDDAARSRRRPACAVLPGQPVAPARPPARRPRRPPWRAGSAEAWLLWRISGFRHPRPVPIALSVMDIRPSTTRRAPTGHWRCMRWSQWREERRRAALRRELLRQDRHWERRLAFAGPPA